MTARSRRDRRSHRFPSSGALRLTRRAVHASMPALTLVGLLLLAACGLSTSPATPTPDPLQQALAEIPAATQVIIRDDWAGLSPAAPILAHYTLQSSPSGMEGKADFQVGEYRGAPITTTEAISIPGSVTQDFLAKLAAVPLKEGGYTPKIDHTDDYPNISVTLEVASGVLSFYSQSQGEGHTPWGASINNKEYVVETPEIAQALDLLTPYRKGDVLERLVEQASNR